MERRNESNVFEFAIHFFSFLRRLLKSAGTLLYIIYRMIIYPSGVLGRRRLQAGLHHGRLRHDAVIVYIYGQASKSVFVCKKIISGTSF